MQADGPPVRTSLTDAASALARHVLDALDGAGDVGPADYVDSCPDTTAALGAVRLLGADLFAPQVLLGRALDPRDAAVVAESFAAYPPVVHPATREQRVPAWRDRAAGRLLALLSATGEPAPFPAGTAPLDPAEGWRHWSLQLARLSPLALPGVGGPVTAAARAGGTALARGAARALLRRDHVTAARLARWIALLAHEGVPTPLDPVPVLEHIRLHGGGGARLSLDLAIARRLLGAGPA